MEISLLIILNIVTEIQEQKLRTISIVQTNLQLPLTYQRKCVILIFPNVTEFFKTILF